jgi:hypothetical protein
VDVGQTDDDEAEAAHLAGRTVIDIQKPWRERI